MRSPVSGHRWGRQLAIDGGEALKVANGLPSSVGYTGRSDEALRPERRTTEALDPRLYLSATLGHAAAMKKRVNVVLAALIFAALGLAMREGLRPKEPVYDGRPVSYWINYSGRADVALDLGRIGRFTGDSNAVPYLRSSGSRVGDFEWFWGFAAS